MEPTTKAPSAWLVGVPCFSFAASTISLVTPYSKAKSLGSEGEIGESLELGMAGGLTSLVAPWVRSGTKTRPSQIGQLICFPARSSFTCKFQPHLQATPMGMIQLPK